ncbi:MAG: hypothetical protein F6K55_44265 [Moorea sp. SIO4A3]|nr:hypothetical protein [Moorena sp. SIO4A3]
MSTDDHRYLRCPDHLWICPYCCWCDGSLAFPLAYYLGILANYLIAASRYVFASSPCLDL